MVFCSPLMNKKKQAYNLLHKSSAVFMILALFWLTISMAFLPVPKESIVKEDKVENTPVSDTGNEEESSTNNSNTEEKVPAGNSFSEEYLHTTHQTHYFFYIIYTFYKCENSGTYIAFHSELLVPPPNHI